MLTPSHGLRTFSPNIGLGIGIAISEIAGQLADAVMVALAAGTFIYVGATEVIAEEFETPHDKWKKFLALTGAVFGVGGLRLWQGSCCLMHGLLLRLRPCERSLGVSR